MSIPVYKTLHHSTLSSSSQSHEYPLLPTLLTTPLLSFFHPPSSLPQMSTTRREPFLQCTRCPLTLLPRLTILLPPSLLLPSSLHLHLSLTLPLLSSHYPYTPTNVLLLFIRFLVHHTPFTYCSQTSASCVLSTVMAIFPYNKQRSVRYLLVVGIKVMLLNEIRNN